jgi:hypothetical protein
MFDGTFRCSVSKDFANFVGTYGLCHFLSFSVSYLLLCVMICACLFVVNVSWLEFSVWSCMCIQFVLVCYVAGTIEDSF